MQSSAAVCGDRLQAIFDDQGQIESALHGKNQFLITASHEVRVERQVIASLFA